MNLRLLLSYSQELRTNIFCLIFAIICCLQSCVFCVTLQPKQAEKGILVGQQVFYTCYREDNEKDGTLKWINPNGQEVEDDPRAPININRGNGLKIFFINTTKKDSGEYTCQYVKDGKVISSASFHIHVYKSIDTSGNKQSYLGVEGEAQQLVCFAKFDSVRPDSQITWWFNNAMITNGDGPFSVKVEKRDSQNQMTIKNILVIKNLTKEHEGIYTCRAVTANQHISDMKNIDINLRVQFPPHFPANTQKYVWISDDMGFPMNVSATCIVNADPVAVFKWFSGDGLPIDHGAIKDKAKVVTSENLSVLTIEYQSLDEINNLGKWDTPYNLRSFTCQAKNSLGSAQTTYELKVGKLPESPVIANHVYDKGLLTFTLNESEIEPPIDIYRIEIANKQFIYFNATNKNHVNNTYEIEVEIPTGKYPMIIYAHNPVGWSQSVQGGVFLAVVSHAFLAQQYLAFVMIGCTLAIVNAL